MNLIDKLKFKLGMWLLFSNPKMTATARMIQEETKNRRCDHCGLNPIHFIDNCECNPKQKA